MQKKTKIFIIEESAFFGAVIILFVLPESWNFIVWGLLNSLGCLLFGMTHPIKEEIEK